MRFAHIHTLAQNIASIDLNKATQAALKARGNAPLEFGGDISELNRDQLKRGERADGTSLPEYSKASVEKFGKPAGAIKLFDTGDFYDGITPEFAKTSFTITNKDSKTDDILYGTGWGAHPDGFGEAVLGLQDESINELAQDALGQIQYELRKQI